MKNISRVNKKKLLCCSLCLGGIVLALGLAGCIPIRQRLTGGEGHSPNTATSNNHPPTEYESPDDFKHLGKDAWKDEMEGIASWYGEDFNGRLTANGEVYDMYAFTAAHKTLPLGTVVKVNNLDNGKNVEVRVNDRGPYVKGRIIDLSRTAGRAIGMREAGTANVKLEIVRWPKEN
jgi:rare lipoprotein A (peptidoglycan hydrolase)